MTIAEMVQDLKHMSDASQSLISHIDRQKPKGLFSFIKKRRKPLTDSGNALDYLAKVKSDPDVVRIVREAFEYGGFEQAAWMLSHAQAKLVDKLFAKTA